jgi:hypothetical protein
MVSKIYFENILHKIQFCYLEVYLTAIKNSIKSQQDANINQGQSIRINQSDEGSQMGKKCC